MKKRLLSILLICCMVLTMLPVTAYAATTYNSAEISSDYYASVDDLESSYGVGSGDKAAVITFGNRYTNKDANLWFVVGKDNAVEGRNTALFAAFSPYYDDSFRYPYKYMFRDSNTTDYSSSYGSKYLDGEAAPTEVAITNYAGSIPQQRLRTRGYNCFSDFEYTLINATTYKNKDLRNNREYTLTDKLYLPAYDAASNRLCIGSDDQFPIYTYPTHIGMMSADGYWTRTASGIQSVYDFKVYGESSFGYFSQNTYITNEGTTSQIDGHFSSLLPATNLDLDHVLFASVVPVQSKSLTDHTGETKAETLKENDVYHPMALRLDADYYDKEIGELYINYSKNEIYAKNVGSYSGAPRRWLVVQYPPENAIFGLNGENGYWCKDISASSEDTDEYGFVHIKLDDIKVDGKTKLSSLENCKIWMETTFDDGKGSSLRAVYTYAVTPKPLPEVTVTTITKFFDPKSGEELTSTTETNTILAGDTFTYSYANKPYISPDKIVNSQNKEVQQETSDYYLKRFRIDNVWEDLTVELTINHYCAAYNWDTVEETPATCTETGLTKGVTCKVCGKVIEERKEIPALGHDLKTTTTATCDTSGHTTTACQREGCTYKTMASTPALGHDWEIETISATCTEGGQVKRTCKRDPSHVETVNSGPLGHDWEKDFTIDVQPTCETAGSKSHHCTRCDEKTDVTEIPALSHDSSWICSLDVTVEAPKCGTVVETRKTYSPEPTPTVTTPEDAPYWLLRSLNPNSADTSWRTVAGKTFTGTIIGGQTYCAEFSLEPKAGSPFFVPDEEDIRNHLTIQGGTLGSLKPHYIWNTNNCDKIEFNVLVTAVHDYDENGICRGCGVANHEHDFENVWSMDEGSHWHACTQDGCTVTEDFGAHSFGEDNATCETCGYVRTITCQHDFGTYLCDADQHWKECRKPGCNVVTSCGKHVLSPSYKNGVLEYYWCQTCFSYKTHDHNITDNWSTSGSHHWKQCYVDNGYCKFVSDYAEHDYGSETGTECVTCGYTRTICDHTYSEGFNSWDETSHWRECTNPACTDRSGSQKDKTAHTLNAYGDCNDCGYRHSNHDYGSWHFDGSGHWKICQTPGCEVQTGKSGHNYSGDICSVCGYDRSITPAHTHFYGEWSKDSQNHWRECADPNCPEETGRIINKAAHIYTDDADTTCELCGYERSVAPDHSGGHVYGAWSWGVNNHWQECTDPDCPNKAGSVQGRADHVYDNDSDATCNVCGYVRSTRLSHTHTFDGWCKDAERHYHICSAEDCPYSGEELDSAAHVYDDDQDEFCNVCAYERTVTPPAHEHTYGDWSHDETSHWHECTDADCPDKIQDKANHVYDDEADADCNVCGYERTVTPPAHEHTYGDWSKDETNHWHECTDANCPDKIQDKANHVYDDEQGTTCNVCGYVRSVTPPTHKHVYGDWSHDETNHWHECTDEGCPDKIQDKANHVYDDEQGTTCNVCGYVRSVTPPTHKHVYGDWSHDETNHWHECTAADCPDKIQDKANHVYDDEADADCNVCGYERSIIPAHEHVYDGWSHDETNHWHECTDANCPDKIQDKANHVYDDDADADCNVCGYVRSVTPPAHKHVYGDWSHDETNHWHACIAEDCPDKTGSVQDKAAHDYDDEADTICSTCGYERTITPPVHEHTYGDWSKDAANHWHECTAADCPDKTGSVKDSAAHVYDNDADTTCNVCGYERTITPPPAAKRQVVVVDSYAPITGAGQYAAGAPVVIYAGSRENYTFVGWTSDDVVITNPRSAASSFLMPDKNVAIKANWVYTGGGSDHSCYTIKATAGAGGSISPSGDVSVREGSDQTFTITPDKGYAVSNVKIDGRSIGAVKSYTFENVTGSHTIEVIFVKGTASAKTGDSSNLPLWSALLLASTLTLAGAVGYKRKRAK